MYDFKNAFYFGNYLAEISFNSQKKKRSIHSRVVDWFEPSVSSVKERKRVCVIGAGWYGCHTALALKKEYPEWDIRILEKNADIISEISGLFGIRLHTGPHYPRSEATREACHKGFIKFNEDYPELINQHSYSIYGVGNLDAAGKPSKVTVDQFASVCKEFGAVREIQPDKWNYRNLLFAVDINEPSVIVGQPLRRFFKKKLKKVDVKVFTNTKVTGIEKKK